MIWAITSYWLIGYNFRWSTSKEICGWVIIGGLHTQYCRADYLYVEKVFELWAGIEGKACLYIASINRPTEDFVWSFVRSLQSINCFPISYEITLLKPLKEKNAKHNIFRCLEFRRLKLNYVFKHFLCEASAHMNWDSIYKSTLFKVVSHFYFNMNSLHILLAKQNNLHHFVMSVHPSKCLVSLTYISAVKILIDNLRDNLSEEVFC